RLAAAAAVTGGTGIGAGGTGTDPEGAAAVAPPDRAAPGAEGVDVAHRQLDRPALDLPPVGAPPLARLDHADVAGGAAHVEAEGVAVAAQPRQQPGPDRAARRSGEDAPGAGSGCLLRRRETAGGTHYLRLRQSRLGSRLGEAPEIAAQ